MAVHRVFVIIAAVFVAFCNYGILQAYGSLFTETLETFGESRSKTTMIHSLLAGTSLGPGVIASYLIKNINLAVVSAIGSIMLPLGFIVSYFATSVTFLIISIGILAGIGISFTYVSAVVVMGTVISEKHKTSALSLQNVACGVPGIVVPYFYAWLTTTYGLSGTFLIYGGITLNNVVASILFSSANLYGHGLVKEIPVVESQVELDSIDLQSRQDGSTTTTTTTTTAEENDDVLKQDQKSEGAQSVGATQTMAFVLFMIAEVLVISTIGGIQTVYQDIGTSKGLSAAQTLSCISAFSIASTIGRFLPFVFQKASGNPFVTPIVASICGVAGQVVLLVTSQYYIVLIGFVLTGLTDGGTSASSSVVIYKILSKEKQTVGFGLVLTLIGVLVTASGPIYGAIFDQTTSYTLVLSITITSFAIGSVLFVACFISYRNQGCVSHLEYNVNNE